MAEPLSAFLVGKRVSDLSCLEGQELLEIDADSTLSESFNKLVHKNVHSAPVFDHAAGKYIGVLDVRDFAKYVYRLFKGEVSPVASVRSILPSEEPAVYLKSDATLLEALKIFGTEHSHCRVHRIPIVDGSGRAVAMLSQSALVQWLLENSDNLGPVVDRTLEESKCGTPHVITVEDSEPLLEVFGHIVSKHINGVAVVNSSNKLVGNISLIDLQLSIEPNLDRIEKPVSNIVGGLRPLVTVTESSTLRATMEKLVKNKVHRVYVCGDSFDASSAGVVTHSDIIDAILNEAATEVIAKVLS